MSVRTTSRSVTFRRAFSLQGVDGMQPPGTYTVETDEELIPGLTFLAYRRMATTITLPVRNSGAAARQMSTIDPADLESALAKISEPTIPNCIAARFARHAGPPRVSAFGPKGSRE